MKTFLRFEVKPNEYKYLNICRHDFQISLILTLLLTSLLTLCVCFIEELVLDTAYDYDTNDNAFGKTARQPYTLYLNVEQYS